MYTSERTPKRCPHCKSRKWNSGSGERGNAHPATPLLKVAPLVTGQAGDSAGSNPASPTNIPLPAMPVKSPGTQILETILSYVQKPVRVQTEELVETMPPCLYKEYDQESGEWYGCRLRAHGPKVKHVRGGKI